MRLGVSPKVNALATILIVAVGLASLVGWWILHRGDKRRARDQQLADQIL